MRARAHLQKLAEKLGIAEKITCRGGAWWLRYAPWNLPVGSESWMLRYSADYSQKRL